MSEPDNFFPLLFLFAMAGALIGVSLGVAWERLRERYGESEVDKLLASERVRRGVPGPKSLLREKGLTEAEASAAVKLGRLPEKTFKKHNSVENPLSPTVLAYRLGQKHYSDALREFLGSSGPLAFRSFCRGHDAPTLAGQLQGEEAVRARSIITEIAEWVDSFEQHLRK